MARPSRINLKNTCQLIKVSGRSSVTFLKTGKQKLEFLTLLGELIFRFNWQCFGFCLLDNSYQLLITINEANLSQGMRELNGLTTQKYNQQTGHQGAVLNGRYHSYIINPNNIEVLKSIHLSLATRPVAEKIIANPLDWKWSHISATLGKNWIPKWLNVNQVKSLFNLYDGEQKSLFVDELLRTKKKKLVKIASQQFMCDRAYREQILKRNSVQMAKNKHNLQQKSLQIRSLMDELNQQGLKRNEAILKIYQKNRFSMKEIGDYINLNYSTISRIISKQKLLEFNP